MSKDIDFPWWYGLIKWVLPLLFAFSSATWFAMCLTGVMSWPSALSGLQWTPGMFQVIDSFYAVGLVSLGMVAIGSVVGFTTALFLRGLFLLPTLENLLIGAHDLVNKKTAECESSKQSHTEHMGALTNQAEEFEQAKEIAEAEARQARDEVTAARNDAEKFRTKALKYRRRLTMKSDHVTDQSTEQEQPNRTSNKKSKRRLRAL